MNTTTAEQNVDDLAEISNDSVVMIAPTWRKMYLYIMSHQ